jgi:hypothetical protein
MNSKTHIFFQEYKKDLFSYGNRKRKYSAREVDTIISLLPKTDKVIQIVWVEAKFPEWHPGHPKNRKLNTEINAHDN